MENIIEKIANHETLTAEDWNVINNALEDVYGWDKDHSDEEDRIWHYVLILAKDKLEGFNLNQLLRAIGYMEEKMIYDFDECYSKLVSKYYMLRENYIKEELEDAVNSLWDNGLDINNETVLREFDERMEYNFSDYFVRELD